VTTITTSTIAATATPVRSPAPAPGSASPAAQVVADPLAATSRDGWSPAEVHVVQSRNTTGFIGSALDFTLGGVHERPGQRLTTGMVDQLAPFYATQFGLDEGFVRSELAQVYLYVGGPAPPKTAMTVGTHIFVPDEASLRHIVSKDGSHWLAHELAHTMQFAAHEGGSPHRFLADYFSGMVLGHDPQQPGSGGGPVVWGAAFTGLRTTGQTERQLGDGATSPVDRALSSIVPAAVVGIPLTLAAGSALKASRVTTGTQLLGSLPGMRTMAGVIGAPALAGAVVGAFGDGLGTPAAQAVGAIGGGAIAGATMWRAGAFQAGTPSLVAAAAATIGGAAIGMLSAAASSNTVRGWSRSSQVLDDLRHDPGNEQLPKLSYKDALHDAHWVEIDAESVARTYTTGGWAKPTGGVPVAGRTPTGPDAIGEHVDADLGDRADWGLKLPLLIGLPAAAVVGGGVLASRTGLTLLDSTVRQGKGPIEAMKAALVALGSKRTGVGNSLGIGAAVTAAPLVAGGLVGPVIYGATGSTTAARVGGAAAGSVAAGVLLTLLLKGKGSSAAALSGKVGVGMVAAGALGLLASGVATDALRRPERTYDVSGGSTAT
jgi:hypothetical protein